MTVTLAPLPAPPPDALKAFRSHMTPYEQKEVMEYTEIWFLGLEAKKIEGVPGAPQNSGYDDENGSYHKVPHDHMAYRYEILEVIGKGSFGQVVKVSGREGKGRGVAPWSCLTPPLPRPSTGPGPQDQYAGGH